MANLFNTTEEVFDELDRLWGKQPRSYTIEFKGFNFSTDPLWYKYRVEKLYSFLYCFQHREDFYARIKKDLETAEKLNELLS